MKPLTLFPWGTLVVAAWPSLIETEWVKFASLDPRAFNSGHKGPQEDTASKASNPRIHLALYLPALNDKQHDSHVKAYFLHLVTGK